MPLRLICALCALALVIFSPYPGSSHPHIWIDVLATFQFKDNKVSGIKVRWTFDEFFSSGIIHDFDKDKNGTFDDTEIAVLQHGAFEATREDNYFTHIKINDQLVRLTKVNGYAAKIIDTTLVMEFVVSLPQPINPATDKLTVSVFDSTYYVDVAYDKIDPVRFTGEQDGFCTFKMTQDERNPIYFNSVQPDLLELLCTGA